MIEAIIDANDRNLNTSLGHWIGDPTWEPGPIHGYTGLMKFVCQPFGPNKIASLIYPHVKIPKNVTFYFGILSGNDLSVWGLPYFAFIITDGQGVDIPLLPVYEPIPAWQWVNYTFTTPPAWNQPTGKILLTVYNPDAAEGSVYIDTFSLQYQVPTKPQYLTLVGVG